MKTEYYPPTIEMFVISAGGKFLTGSEEIDSNVLPKIIRNDEIVW